jgi:signal transduction histidine kinase
MSGQRRLRDLRRHAGSSEGWALFGRGSAAASRADPAARMFSGIRLRMALWYTAILGIILGLAGVLLYLGMQSVLLAPVLSQLQHEAGEQTLSWQRQGDQAFGCASGAHLPAPYIEACFDASGKLLSANLPPYLPASVVSSTLASAALANTPSGTASDTVTVQSQGQSSPTPGQGEPVEGTGTFQQTIYRYATVVTDPTTQRTMGVLLVALDITGEAHALNTLLTLLLAVGGFTLLICGVGGAVLAARALAPAHLAFARQQAFIADASHELRTPLTVLRANAEVLLRGRDHLDPDDALLLDDIVAEVAHMSALSENLLLLARLDAGTVRPEREIVNLGDVAATVARQMHALATEREIRLDMTAAGDALVLGDPMQLSEVALILVDNATKYNRPGGAVSVRTYQHGGQAVLEVRDTGVGIAVQDLKRLGERFYRVEKARSRQMGGAGLGLAIARRLAAAHAGTLTLESVPGQGTTATLRLPAAGLEK